MSSLSYLEHFLEILGGDEARDDAGEPAPSLWLDEELQVAEGRLYKPLALKYRFKESECQESLPGLMII